MLGATLFINNHTDTRGSDKDRRLSHEIAYDEAQHQAAALNALSPRSPRQSPGTSLVSSDDDDEDDNVLIKFWNYG
jgi:hypothetical protein